MHFHIITIFPDMFDSYLNESIIKRAQEDGVVSISFYNIRDFTKDKHKTVDDTPYGGGPGMVMKAEPILKAVESAIGDSKDAKIVLLHPGGTQLTNEYADTCAKQYKDIVIIAGRYEGIDARVRDILDAEEISVGPYTLTGGEVPTMILIDCISRRVPGVLGNEISIEERRAASHDVYTRPEVITYEGKEYSVPEVLLSGDHEKIEAWREEK